jgi:tRNA (cmo5U34)-methyltransferase
MRMSYVHAKNTNLWQLPEHALAYLAQADAIPHRAEGEAVLLEFLPPRVSRVLDLGSGEGRLLTLVRFVNPHVHGVALDFSEAMIQRLQERFASDPSTPIVRHDLDAPLPPFDAPFDAVVSSFAIRHLPHTREAFAIWRNLRSPCARWRVLQPGARGLCDAVAPRTIPRTARNRR